MTSTPATGVSRRAALRALGLGTGVFGLSALVVPTDTGTARSTAQLTGALTVTQWRASTTGPVYVAHRGSGDVYPEHSMEAYRAAVDWGAECLEISVALTEDGVLICMHDATYDRTTTGSGIILEQPSSVLDTVRIWQPQLGAAWTRTPPLVPRFADVLTAFGGKVILCVEAKTTAAYEPMMALVEDRGLRDSVIIKGHYTSSQLYRAQAAGYPVFSYFGTAGEVTAGAIDDLGGRLRPEQDILVVAGLGATPGPYLPDELVRAAVATGVPVWVHPLHRRSEAQHFFDLGVAGAICSSYGYVANAIASVAADSWASQAIAAGQVSKSAGSASYAASFDADGTMVLGAKGVQHFLLLGQFCPLPAAATTYQLDVELSWVDAPALATDALSLAFGHDDDRYYEHRSGNGTGYHVILRVNGELVLYLHRDGEPDGEQLGPSVNTPKLRPGDWARLRVSVTPDEITVRRVDVDASITASDTTVRGGYLHLGRGAPSGVAAFRKFAVS